MSFALALFAGALLQNAREFPEAERFLGRVAEAESLLKEAKKAEARKVAEELSAPGAAAGLVWWMFSERHSRFADLADALFDQGLEDAARAFLVSIAPLSSHADRPTVARFSRVLRGSPEAAFVLLREGTCSLKDLGMTMDDVRRIVDGRLGAGTAVENDILFLRHRDGCLEVIRKGALKFAGSWSVQECWGDAALLADKPGEAARAYAASLELTGEPVERDRSQPIRAAFGAVQDVDRPRLVKLASAVLRDRGVTTAEAAIERHAGSAFRSNLAEAYERIGSIQKAAPLWRRILLGERPDQFTAVSYGLQVARLIEIYVQLGDPVQAVMARRVLLKDFPPAGYREAGAIKSADVVARCDRALGDAPDRLPIDRLIRELSENQSPDPNQVRQAGERLRALGDADPSARDAALAGLKSLGPAISPVLVKELGSTDAEVRGRLGGLLRHWALQAAEERFRRE